MPASTNKLLSRIGRVAAVAVACQLLACGPFGYLKKVAVDASRAVGQAEKAGAKQYAPYEYWFALEHLDKAQTEASEGDYGDAIELVNIGEEYADKAIQLARDAHRGAGR